MENASKALIMVYQNAKGTIDDANLNTEEAQAFNTKISQYCGKKKTASNMNALVDAVAASNGAQNKLAASQRHYVSIKIEGTSQYITGNTINVTGSSGTGEGNTASSLAYPSFNAGTTFTASYTTDPSTGYINEVTIKAES